MKIYGTLFLLLMISCQSAPTKSKDGLSLIKICQGTAYHYQMSLIGEGNITLFLDSRFHSQDKVSFPVSDCVNQN